MEIDVAWLAQTLTDLPDDDDWMSTQERERRSGRWHPKRIADWRLGRWVAKRAVRASTGIDSLERIEIFAADSGAPRVRIDEAPVPLAISISHSGERALCVLAEGTVALGCDIETIETRSSAFVADYFTSDEQQLIETDRDLLATLLWSAKESALKALEEGLRLDTRSVVVVPHIGGTPQAWQPLATGHSDSGREFRGWWRRQEDVVQTVVAEARSVRLHELAE